jgi:hypothetical protein
MPFDILRQSREPPSESEAFEQVIKRESSSARRRLAHAQTCRPALQCWFTTFKLYYINCNTINQYNKNQSIHINTQ